MTDKNKKKIISTIKTIPVPFDLREIKDNIIINNNLPNKPSKEEIIKAAFKFHSEGKLSEAAKLYKYFIDQGFSDPNVFSNYGVICQQSGLIHEAIKLYKKSIDVFPNNQKSYFNLGTIFKEIGKLKEAELSYRKAIEIKSDYADAYSNLGNLLKDLGKLQEAELLTRKAIELNPNLANAHNNLGSILIDLGKLQEAELSIRKAIELNSELPNAYSNLGILYKDLGKLEEAELSTKKAIELDPDCLDTYFNLAVIQLLRGNYDSGLNNYELRLNKTKSISLHAKPKIKRIYDINFQEKEKILIVSEQGLGDTLQYMRYVPYLRDKGLNISFCAQTKLHSLIKASAIDTNPLTPDQANEVADGKWIPLLSLPNYLQISPKNPIISKPYIFSTDELIKKWKNILSNEKRPIIGINWQGNRGLEQSIYRERSLPLEIFSVLFVKNKFRILSLQKGFGSEQLENCSFKEKFVGCQSEIDSTWDFLENAAIIQNCDLIITSDTSIAHLAGGMGKKVWLLLKDVPFWTWGLKSTNTFWYPSMTLFRQKERNNWHELMERVSDKLKEEIE